MKTNKQNLIIKPLDDIQQMMMDIASGKIILQKHKGVKSGRNNKKSR